MEQQQQIIKLVNARGIGWGYQVGAFFVRNGEAKLRPIKSLFAPAPRIKKAVKLLVFQSLQKSIYCDGGCPHCQHYPNETKVWKKTDMGTKGLIRCNECAKLFLPAH